MARETLIGAIGGGRSDDSDDPATVDWSDPAPTRSLKVRLDVEIPSPPDLDRQLVRRVEDLRDVWRFINPQMLYGKHMGMRGRIESLMADGEPKVAALVEMVAELQDEAESG